MDEHVAGQRQRWARTLRRLPLVGWLLLVWVMLWGQLDVGTVLFGLVVAVLVSSLFPMPAITTNLLLRPWPFVRLVAYLAWDLMISTVRVSWQALRYGPRAPAGIVAVPLKNDSDHLTAMVANSVSLAPGKSVMRIDRANQICYVYALGIAATDAEAVRREVLRLERRIVRALGSKSEVDTVEARPWPGGE